MNPKVSIIIPVYNPGDLLVKCLDSVVSQTLNEIECICIDDESTDNSLEILQTYAKNDNRFKILTQKHSGAGTARNKGIENSNGEYIVFLDSDDWIERDMCESLYIRAKQLDVDLILFDSTRHVESNKNRDLIHFDLNKFNEYSIFDYHKIKDKVLNGPYGVIWCKFYKTSFIKENNIDFPKHIMYNDVEFHIKSLLLSKKIAYYPKIFYHYMRVEHQSLQNSLVNTSEAMVFYDVMKDIESFLNDFKFMDEFKTEFLNFSFYEFRNKLNSIDLSYKEEYYKIIKEFFLSLSLEVSNFNNLDIEYFIFYLNLINSETYQEFEDLNNYSLKNNINSQKEYLKRKEFLKNIHTLIKVELEHYKYELETLKDDLKMVNEVNHDSFEYLLLKLGLDISELNKYDFNKNKSSDMEISNIIHITKLVNEIDGLKKLIKTKEQENKNLKDENEFLINKNNDLNTLLIKKDEKINILMNKNNILK